MLLKRIWLGNLGGLRLVMLLAVGGLLLIGLASIYATGQIVFFNKQVVWIGVGLGAFFAVNLIPYRKMGQVSYPLFGLTLILLVIVLAGKYVHLPAIVPMRNYAYRWIKIGPLQLQPSEMAKLTYLLALAWYLRHRESYRNLRGLVGPFMLTLLPMVLILLEPDLGTTLLFPPILFAVLFIAGARVKHLLTFLLLGLLISPVMYLVMKPYQQTRIQSLLYQNSDDPYWLSGPGYHLHQSKICIGSGQVTGQGWKQGIFVNSRKSLPERHNDFIFSLIAHQWGFLGCLVVLGLYILIILGGVEIAAHQTDPFGRLLALGIAALFAVQMIINVGMTMGLTPITGMTLPFISYGGSSLLSSFLALGLLVNVARFHPRQIGRRSFEFQD